MKADLIFHNVGQGLFYTGRIKCSNGSDFNFVYDCGATEKYCYDRSITLDTCIDRYTKYLDKQDIDMLVVSHFHHDHINGIAKLLENNVKNVVIPFYTFEERFITYFTNEVEDITNDQLSFLLDPYQFFLNRDVERIIVVHHQKKHNETNKPIDFNEILINNIPEGSEYDELRNYNNIVVIDDITSFKISNCWNFAFYADDKFKSNFKQDEAKAGIEKLNKAQNKQERQKAINEIKSSYDISSGQMNETSLIMVHKFDDSRLMDIYLYPITSHHRYWHFEECHYLWREEQQIHILTGDFNFQTTKWDNVKKHFGSFIDGKNLVMQIAHHGSIDNWDNDISRTNNHSLFVIPYGTKNPHGHPSINVVKDIVISHNCLFEVTENQSLMMFYR